MLERWESAEAVRAFRGGGPDDEQAAVILHASVAEYEVVSSRSLTDGPARGPWPARAQRRLQRLVADANIG